MAGGEFPGGTSPEELYLDGLKKMDSVAVVNAVAEIAKDEKFRYNSGLLRQLKEVKMVGDLGEDDVVIPGLEIGLKNASFTALLKQLEFAEKLVGKLGIKKLEEITFKGWREHINAVILHPHNFVGVGLYMDPNQPLIAPYFHMNDVGGPYVPEDRISRNKIEVAQYFTKVTLPRIPKHK